MNRDETNILILIDMFKKLNIELSEKQIEQFLLYYRFLMEKNKVMNLTAITEYQEVVLKHFADSLSVVKIYDMNTCANLIDVGTGAGFPGIPLKIVFPHLKTVLLDSLNKRIVFLNELIGMLHLEEITAVHARAEDAARNTVYREQFDLCVSRAVAGLSSLLEYCLPFVRSGGFFVSYKSGKAEDEIREAEAAIRLFGGRIEKKEEFLLPDSDFARTLIVVKKIKPTPKKFPRKARLNSSSQGVFPPHGA